MAEIALKHFLFAYLCIFFSSFASTNLCVQKNPCLCLFSEHEVLDISNVTKDKYLVASFNNYEYHYAPCHDMKLEDTNCSLTSLCVIQKTNTNVIVTDLGKANIGKFNSHDTPIQLIYSVTENKTDVTSIVKLICAPDMIKPLLFVNSTEKNNYHELLLVTKHACPFHITEEDSSLSTGSALLILFTIGAAIYFFGGACLLYYLRGARGVEVIPNVEFWRGLPSLVRDGFLFLLNGCHLPSTMTATAETYDRI